MAEHDIEKIVESGGDVFNFRDPTKQPVADRVTSIRASSSATDTNYPSEKAVADALESKAPSAVTSEVTIANGDKMIIADASDSSKLKRASAAFDGSTTKKFLNQKGTFTQVLEADLEWGGNFRTSKSPSEAFTRQNLWFNPKSSAVYVEYCTDRTSANPTWLPYGETDTDKLKLFSGGESTSAAFYCGKNTHVHPGYTGSSGTKDLTDDIVPDQGLRITICCRSLSSRDADVDNWSYGQIVRILMYVSTNSASGGPRHCKVETMTGANFKAGNDTWTDRGDYNISGDSGWNSIPLQVTFGSGWTQTSQVWVVRFTIWAEALAANPASSQTGNLRINTIAALSKMTWTSNDSMKSFGTPYGITESGGAVFNDIKFTARKLKTNLARTADSTFDGSADQLNIPVTGTLPVGNGGTGKSSVTSGNYLVGNGTSAFTEKAPKTVGNNVLAALDEGSSAFSTDNAVIITGDAAASNTTTFYRRKFSYIWTWIQSKISTVLGLSTTGYTGNATTADTAKAYDHTFSGTDSIASALGLKQNLVAWDLGADTYNASTNRAATVDSIVKRIAVKPDGFSASVDYTNAVELSIPYSAGPGRVALMCVATTGNGDSVSFQATFVKNANEKLNFVVGTIMASTGTFVTPILKFLSSDDSSPAQKVVLYIDANVRCNISCLVAANDGMSSITVTEVARSTASQYASISWGRLANDSGVVHIDGAETIIGAKEFSRSGQDTNFTDSSGAESIVRARTSSNSNNGSCQIDAYAGGGKFGLYARNASGTGKWVANLDNDGVVNLGSSGDAVRIGGTKFVFGASQLGTDSNTFYWV